MQRRALTRLRTVLCGILVSCVNFVPACASSSDPLTKGDIGISGGVAGLDNNGAVYAPVVGKVDAATVAGTPLSYIIPAMTQQLRISDKYLSSAVIGQPNGVLGLNADAAAVIQSYLWVGALPALTLKDQSGNTYVQSATSSITTGNFGDDWISSRTVMFGGHQEDDSVPLDLYAQPMGGLNLGTALSVLVGDQNYAGQRPAVYPYNLDGSSGISQQSEFEGVGIVNQTQPSVPLMTLNSVTKDPTGVTHGVSFDVTHVYFDHPLPAAWISKLHKKMRIMTNIVGGAQSVADPNAHQPINTWSAEVEGWDAGGNSLTVSGWRIPGMTTNGVIPGTAVNGVAANTYDKTISSYTVPTIFLGGWTKSINRKTSCSLHPATAPSDVNNPKGSVDTPTRDCMLDDMEINNSLPDYQGKVTGIGISYNGPSLPSSDSYGLSLSGSFPRQLVINGLSTGVDIDADSLWVHGNGGVSGATTGSTQETAEFNAKADTSDMLRMVQWNTRNSTATGSGSQTANFGLITNGDRGHIPGDGYTGNQGSIQSYLAFNPAGYLGGLGLCGQNTCGLYVDAQGIVHFPTSLQLPSATFLDSSGNSVATLATTATGKLNLTANNAAAQFTTTIPFVSSSTISAPTITLSDASSANALLTGTAMIRTNSSNAPWLEGLANEMYIGVTPDASTGKGYVYLGSNTNISKQLGLKIDQSGTIYPTQVSNTLPVISSPQIWAGNYAGVSSTVGSKSVFFESGSLADTDALRLKMYNQRDASGTGYATVSTHISLALGGTTGSTNGTEQSSIVYNPNGLIGAIGIYGSSGKGLTVLSDGTVQCASGCSGGSSSGGGSDDSGSASAAAASAAAAASSATQAANSAAQAQAYVSQGSKFAVATYNTLPTSPNTGDPVYCSDCYSKLREAGDSATGIPVYWNGSSWRDSLGIVVLH